MYGITEVFKKKRDFTPYGINLEYELKTYKYVGKDYGNRKDTDLGLRRNISRWYRRRNNKKEKSMQFVIHI